MSNFIDKEYQHWKAKIILFLKGFSMGFADIIPGVSGGTIALISGIYEHLINAISSIKFYHIPSFIKFLFLKDIKSIERLKEIPFIFLIVLVSGIATGILSMSRIIPFLMDTLPFYTYSLFFGLILFSVTIPFKHMEHKITEYIILIIFSIFTFWLVDINPYQDYEAYYYTESYQKKIRINDNGKANFQVPFQDIRNLKISIKEKDLEIDKIDAISEKPYQYYSLNKTNILIQWEKTKNDEVNIKLSISKKGFFPFIQESLGRYIWVFFIASIAICAMILPGISGAYMLVLFGEYQNILRALYEFDIMTVLFFVAGIMTGILSFVRFLKFLLKNYHSYTMAALTGFLIGSLNKIFPYKYLSPDYTYIEIVIGLIVMIAGGVFLYFLERLSIKLEDPEAPI